MTSTKCRTPSSASATWNRAPGVLSCRTTTNTFFPEVFVQKAGDEWPVTTNNEHVPHLRISNTYKDLMSQADSSAEVREYIREKIRAGKFLIKSLHQRQQTILNIANEIVQRQREFLEKGVAFLKPLTMLQIAEVVGVHETTVSRAVSGKYMQTPAGHLRDEVFLHLGHQDRQRRRHVQHVGQRHHLRYD